jgi:serine/threonine-protein kinase
MGTPDYLSPEQARSLHGVDGRADIYSLGCTFYYLLTQRIPYEGGTTMEKLVRHSTEHAVPVNTLRPEIPVQIAVIVQKMMAKKPDDRFQSAAELAAVLLPFSGQETTSWVAVESLPTENILPISNKSLPRLPVLDANHDPFANLDSQSDSAQMVGTLPGDGALTDLSESTSTSSSRRRRKVKKKDSGMLAAAILFLVILGVGAGIALTLKYVVFKGS